MSTSDAIKRKRKTKGAKPKEQEEEFGRRKATPGLAGRNKATAPRRGAAGGRARLTIGAGRSPGAGIAPPAKSRNAWIPAERGGNPIACHSHRTYSCTGIMQFATKSLMMLIMEMSV